MPAYTEFVLTADESALIAAATDAAGVVDWGNAFLVPVRSRIRELHLEIQNNSCCYCRKSLVAEFKMVIDVEHILPKKVFNSLTFAAVNLSVSCKKCNLFTKRNRWGFVGGASMAVAEERVLDSSLYEIIHPNLDFYKDHLPHRAIEIDDFRFRKFLRRRATNKGLFTYSFFRLNDVEVGQLDKMQGLIGEVDSVMGLILREIEDGIYNEPLPRRMR